MNVVKNAKKSVIEVAQQKKEATALYQAEKQTKTIELEIQKEQMIEDVI